MAMHSPLEQFQVNTLAPFSLAGHDLPFTNASLFMLLALAASALLLLGGLGRGRLVPTRMQMLSETIYGTISNMVDSVAGPKARPFFPFIFSLFIFILFGNLLGLFPGAFTFTSHLVVTFALAALVFLAVTITGFVKHGFHFLHLFIPAGTPLALIPVMFVIELFSFCIRPFSLAIRLFANMLAGHILLKVFAGLAIMLVAALGTLGYAVAILPVLMNIFVVGFEFFVAGLQAYIFAILASVYLRDALEMH